MPIPEFRMFRFDQTRRSRLPGRRWLAAARSQAHCVFLYVPGVQAAQRWCGPHHMDEPAIRRIERMVKLNTDYGRGRIAFLMITRPTQLMLRRKPATARIPQVIHRLRQSLALPIGILAEDFSCRCLLHAGAMPPDHLILDTPVLSYEELASPGYDCPTILRRARWSRATPFAWSAWNVRFPYSQWCCHSIEEARQPIGVWRSPDKREWHRPASMGVHP